MPIIVTRYYPQFVDADNPVPVHIVDKLEDFLKIDYIIKGKELPRFYQYSYCTTYAPSIYCLMLELSNENLNDEWYVIAFFSNEPTFLPKWKPKPFSTRPDIGSIYSL